LILELLPVLFALCITVISTYSAVSYLAPNARWLTKATLSFAFGYAVISLAGIAAALLRVDPLGPQIAVVLVGFGFAMHRSRSTMGGWRQWLDKEDVAVIAMASFYLLICLLFLDRINMWMGGDSVAHASIIRMLIDGQTVPISLPPLGTYWEYYPKGFHFYASLWARAFPILDVVRTIPLLMTAITPLLLYSIARELGRKEEALFAFVLACFVFSAHYSYLIWGGYPSLAAEMLLVAVLLAILVENRSPADWLHNLPAPLSHIMSHALILVFLLGILFTHARLVVLVFGVLFAWLAATRLHRYLAYILVSLAVLIVAACVVFSAHKPVFLISILAHQNLAEEYAARWYPAFLSLFGAVIALARRDKLDRLAGAWTVAIIIMTLLADIGPLESVASADRVLMVLYLPLSLLAAFALVKMERTDRKIEAGFLLVLLLSGIVVMGVVFQSYTGSWAIPKEDYKAIMWLGTQNYSDALCINLDETGSWVYPLTGITVAKPRMETGALPFGAIPSNNNMIKKIVDDPGSIEVADALRRSGYARNLIYISNVSLSRPGYVPPFEEYGKIYPSANISFPKDKYDLIYSRGVYIFGFPKGAFLAGSSHGEI
jgi:hypothetical protein